jgi:ABC-type nitrate/sulfonate/bicarbonate transport system ATPase subunit
MWPNEPFASVDAQTRPDLENLVAALRDQFGIAITLIMDDIDWSTAIVRMMGFPFAQGRFVI